MRHRLILAGALIATGLAAVSASQQPLTPQAIAERAARFKQQSIDAEAKGLSEPFKGITANGSIAPGLFGVRSTGVSTESVRKAADAFLAALSSAARSATQFKVDDDEWRKWMNQDFYVRQGVGFNDMTEAQREAGFALLRAGLSAKGLKQTRDIMKLNHTLGELTGNDFDRYSEWLYHITVMGTPSATEPWGWQFDGHHAIINYFVLGDQVVMTPFFAGSEPVIATSGKYSGTAVLQDEQAAGRKMINALAEAQRKAAMISAAKTRNNNLTEAWRDNAVVDYAGASAAEFSAAQQQQLVDLIGLYVANMADGHARVRMDDVRRHIDQTRFAWIGETAPGSVFYYRIHSPVILIEFDHQTPANLRHLAKDPTAPNPQHIHVVVRTPNGNDYGKDLLRQHYAQHPHPSPIRER
ncbi:MAG: hypothetical protein CK533_03235 [Acidobacterium sp.]|nr:DUF3500 domain-containing protein [Acidobacteriota bacterium]PHY11587.1 MAG: hypothetical protein CK533_03235 [Acidobacterium sp.]